MAEDAFEATNRNANALPPMDAVAPALGSAGKSDLVHR